MEIQLQNNSILTSSIALLVIDVQSALFERSTPIFNAELLIKNINTLIEECRQVDVPIFFIQHSNKKFLVRGSKGWQFHPDLDIRRSDSIIPKIHGDAFQDTVLNEEIKAGGIDTLLITGLVTQGCVRATCLGALDLGYRVVLIQDGHSNYNKGASQVIQTWNKKLAAAGAGLLFADAVRFV